MADELTGDQLPEETIPEEIPAEASTEETAKFKLWDGEYPQTEIEEWRKAHTNMHDWRSSNTKLAQQNAKDRATFDGYAKLDEILNQRPELKTEFEALFNKTFGQGQPAEGQPADFNQLLTKFSYLEKKMVEKEEADVKEKADGLLRADIETLKGKHSEDFKADPNLLKTIITTAAQKGMLDLEDVFTLVTQATKNKAIASASQKRAEDAARTGKQLETVRGSKVGKLGFDPVKTSDNDFWKNFKAELESS